MTTRNEEFWDHADRLVAASRIIVDRPRGSRHPRYPDTVYPLDYGYLENTTAADGDGIDVWLGTLVERRVTGMIVALDLLKRDVEVKLLIGCTSDEADHVLTFQRSESQSAVLVPRS